MYLDYEISLDELTKMAESFEDGTGFPMIPSGPSGLELPEGFELPDDFELPEIPEN